MRHYRFLLFFTLFLIACDDTASTSDDSIAANNTYCDCNDLVLDPGYNRYYLENPKEPFTGNCEIFHKNGKLALFKNFVKGKLNGEFVSYYTSGQIEESKFFDMNLQSGDYHKYNENGILIYHGRYKNGRQVETVFINTNSY